MERLKTGIRGYRVMEYFMREIMLKIITTASLALFNLPDTMSAKPEGRLTLHLVFQTFRCIYAQSRDSMCLDLLCPEPSVVSITRGLLQQQEVLKVISYRRNKGNADLRQLNKQGPLPDVLGELFVLNACRVAMGYVPCRDWA